MRVQLCSSKEASTSKTSRDKLDYQAPSFYECENLCSIVIRIVTALQDFNCMLFVTMFFFSWTQGIHA